MSLLFLPPPPPFYVENYVRKLKIVNKKKQTRPSLQSAIVKCKILHSQT